MIELIENSNKLLDRVSKKFKRFLFHKIEWNIRLIEIIGSRGVGKTTLMQQKAYLLNNSNPGVAIYTSLDDPYFFNHSIIDLVEEFEQNGGKYIFLDEVHKYPSKYLNYDWASEIKTIYDRYPGLGIVYSGSSILKLYKGQGDLSRRKVTYRLPGLSFREYLSYNGIADFNAYQLEDIIKRNAELSGEISKKIKIIPQFKNYLSHGYYPFYNEAPNHYLSRLKAIIAVIMEVDIPSVADITFETSTKLKKLLSVVAGSAPFTPNLSKIRSELYISDQRTLLKYLNYLEISELIMVLDKHAKGNQLLRKPAKLYLDNPNLSECFYNKPDIGTLRETFFSNQTGFITSNAYTSYGDFLVSNKWIFEVGGKNKKFSNKGSDQKIYLAIDNIETGYGRTIPLWLFGFLY